MSGTLEASRNIEAIAAPPIRWGYEFAPPPVPSGSPERLQPPVARTPTMVPAANASGLRQALGIAAVATVVELLIDITFFFGKHKVPVIYLPAHCAAAYVAFHLRRAYDRWEAMQGGTQVATPGGISMRSVGIVVLALLIPYLVLPYQVVRIWKQIGEQNAMLVPDRHDQERAQAEHATQLAAWQRRIEEYERREQEHYATADVWYPVCPSNDASGVCVFGGSQVSWAASLVTLGATLIGRGHNVLICDLSRRVSTPALREVCEEAGVPTRVTILPDQARSAGLLADLSWNELSTILVEVLYAAHPDPAGTRSERQEDRAIIREIAEALDQRGRVSLSRLRQAMLVVEGARIRNGQDLISDHEFDALASLYNDVQREHGGVMERLTRIERALRDFEILDGRDVSGAVELRPPLVAGPRGSLDIIEVDKRAEDLDNDRLVDLLFQLVARRVRLKSTQADTLIVLGGDRIHRDGVESLMTHAGDGATRVFLYFEHLRHDAVELVGAGGAAAGFFALGNHHEAKEASDFIGSDYKFVESQRTRSTGESLTNTYGRESGTSVSGRGDTSTSSGTSYSRAMTTSSETSTSDQRVREALMEPEVIMGLPAVEMVYVEVRRGGQRLVKTVDCHPARCLDERVSQQPLALQAG